MVVLTSEGRWLTTIRPTPYLRPSLAIRSKFSSARFSRGAVEGALPGKTQSPPITDDQNGRASTPTRTRRAPELDLIDKPGHKANNDGEDVRGHLRKINDLDAGIKPIFRC